MPRRPERARRSGRRAVPRCRGRRRAAGRRDGSGPAGTPSRRWRAARRRLASSSDSAAGSFTACRAPDCPRGCGRAPPSARVEPRGAPPAQWTNRPRRQAGQARHGAWWCGTTRSPAANPVTPSPTATISPATSWPAIVPAFPRAYQSSRSDPQMPAARVRRSASPGPIRGLGHLDDADVSARVEPRRPSPDLTRSRRAAIRPHRVADAVAPPLRLEKARQIRERADLRHERPRVDLAARRASPSRRAPPRACSGRSRCSEISE